MRYSLIIPVFISAVMLAGCGTIPNAVVEPTNMSIKVPDKNAIKSVDITSDSASAMAYYPNDQGGAISEVVTWLQNATEVTVHFPKVHVQTGTSGGYTGPSILNLHLKNEELAEVLPGFYVIPSKHGYSYRYLDGIVEYKNSWDGTDVYFKSPSLYQWLKRDQWKSQFHMSGGVKYGPPITERFSVRGETVA